MKNEIIAPFAYDGLPEIARAALRASAERIRELVRRSTTDIIETGQELIQAKKKLEHGQFGGWLEAEFNWSERTAQLYMRAAQQFGDKTEIISVLQPTTVYLLSAPSTPDMVKNEIIERAAKGERVPIEMVRERLSEHRHAQRQAKKEAKRSPEARKREAQRRAKARAELEQRKRADEQAKQAAAEAASEMVEILRDRLGDDLDRFLELWRVAFTGYVSFEDIARRLDPDGGTR